MQKSDYIFGLRAILEAIDARKEIDKVMMKKGLQGELAHQLLSKTRQLGILIQWVPMEKLNRITMKNHQGAIAMLSPISYFNLEDLVISTFENGGIPLLLILDGITDTRNLGAIARTAECAGFDAIIIPEKGSAGVTPDAIKTSAGALLTLPVCRVKSLTEAVDYLKKSGISIVGASEKGKSNFTEVSFTNPVAIVMGAEDTGISTPIIKACDTLAKIPILGSIGSLNVSVAAGIITYEAVMQRLRAGSKFCR